MKVDDKVRQLILQHYHQWDLQLSDLKDGARFQVDLPDDTLGIVELIMLCEEEFDIEIQDEYAEACVTVGGLIKCIEEKLDKKSQRNR
jgi:acyl carrier protein